MLTVTKRFHFCYGHKLKEYNGLCKNIHGHNSVLEVEIKESKNTKYEFPNMIIDFSRLKKIVKEEVIDILDHQFLNTILVTDYPTAEYITKWIVKKLKVIFGDDLVRVRLTETDDSWAEWKADEIL